MKTGLGDGPVLLAFDTATEHIALAAGTPAAVHTLVAPGGAAASAALVPALRELLARGGHRFDDLAAIAFGRGPGAFTGLRTSAAVAQGLAFGTGAPVLAIDSLLIVAEGARGAGAGPDIVVAMDARMGEVYAARYHHDGTRWHTRVPPMLCSPAALMQTWEHGPLPDAVAGSAIAAFGDRIAWPAQAVRHGEEADRAAALWRLALGAFHAGERLDAADALPLYLRDKVALTTAERAAAAR
jgi:tRNA threonylcarbamoyladenosine biosynthesis protein TsaB